MSHSREKHDLALDKLCRICGGVTLTQKERKAKKVPYSVNDLSRDIAFICGTDTSKDALFHSKYVCHKCFKKLDVCKKRSSTATKETLVSLMDKSTFLWQPFNCDLNEEACHVCAKNSQLRLGAIQMKPPDPAIPNPDPNPDNTLDTSISESIQSDSIPIDSSSDIDLVCDDSSFEAHASPIDPKPRSTACASIQTSPLKQSNTPEKQMPYMCISQNTTPLHNIAQPTSSSTPIYITPKKKRKHKLDLTSPMKTIQQAIDKPESQPLSKTEEKLATKLIQRKLYPLRTKKRTPHWQLKLRFKTRGRPMTFIGYSETNKSFDEAGKTTKSNRGRWVNKVRNIVDSNLKKELSVLPRTRRDDVMKTFQSGIRVTVNRRDTLALKEALGLTSRKARLMTQTMRDLGVRMAGEEKQKELARHIVQDAISVETKLFRSENLDQITEVPYAKCQNLPKFVDRRLDEFLEHNKLVWHDGGIPEDDIWVKVGADHGKNLLKFTLEIANVSAPNAKDNTVVIGTAGIKDNYQNLKTFLDGGILYDINLLQSHKWNEKQIKVFLNGDYDFLCKAYGLSGAVGCYPCIWCRVHKTEFSDFEKNHELRSLDSIRNMNRPFMEK